MPLVFAANQRSTNEQNYRDVLDVEYEFPTMYRKRIREGEPFIYYRGLQGPGPHGYFGAGIVGPIRDSDTPGRLFCEVLDPVFFVNAVPLRDPVGGKYLEEVGTNQVNMRQGVRLITDERAARILQLAGASTPPPPIVPPVAPGRSTTKPGTGRNATGYAASQQTIEAIFRYSTDEVVSLLKAQFPAASVKEMPSNNPGYDIGVTSGSHLYVEVKGTQLPEVAFFLSEGERAFSAAHADDYALCVVYHIDLDAKTHKVAWFSGAIDQAAFALAPIRYRVTVVDGMTVSEP